MADAPFMRGEHCRLTCFIGSGKKDVHSKSFSVTRNVTKINDGVNGEDRDRVDVAVNYYELQIQLYVRDVKMIQAFIEDQAVEDGGVQPLDKSFAIGLKPRDGSKYALSFREGTIDDWKLDIAGRTDRQMITMPMRFRYCESVPL